MHKYLKKSIGAAAIAATMTISLLATPKIVLAKQTGATLSDIASYCSFEHELHEISTERNIVFHNSELYNILNKNANGNITLEYLHSITNLIFAQPLSNNDLSDLKYLPNLKSIEIQGMNIDCHDLMYNQKLTSFNAVDCNIKNTQDLPNTIRNLYIQNSLVTDNVVYVPYNTTDLELDFSTFTKVKVKNPLNLHSICFKGYSLFDLEDIKDCLNLKDLELTKCPNIKNSHYITTFNSLKNLKLDDYSCIWLSKNTLANSTLDTDTKTHLKSLMDELDNIAFTIVNSDMSEEDKLNAIILYVADKIDYDKRVSNEETGHEALTRDYNDKPIYFALNSSRGICVNYACLFTALANRLGIDNYQPSSITHTWNMVKLNDDTTYNAYDIGGLDGLAILRDSNNEMITTNTMTSEYLINNITNDLYYYSFNLDSADSTSYETDIRPININNIIENIGYLSSKSFEAFQAQFFVILVELIALYIAGLIKLEKINKKEAENTPILKYKRVE